MSIVVVVIVAAKVSGGRRLQEEEDPCLVAVIGFSLSPMRIILIGSLGLVSSRFKISGSGSLCSSTSSVSFLPVQSSSRLVHPLSWLIQCLLQLVHWFSFRFKAYSDWFSGFPFSSVHSLAGSYYFLTGSDSF